MIGHLEQDRSHLDQLASRLQQEEALEAGSLLEAVPIKGQAHPELLQDQVDPAAQGDGEPRLG